MTECIHNTTECTIRQSVYNMTECIHNTTECTIRQSVYNMTECIQQDRLYIQNDRVYTIRQSVLMVLDETDALDHSGLTTTILS